MAVSHDPLGGASGEPVNPALIHRIERAGSLAELAEILGTPSERDAYFSAKAHWRRASTDLIRPERTAAGLPGDQIDIDGCTITVHGLTHADSDPEHVVVRQHATDALDAGAELYCEQGIRRMYLADVSDACEMDDYRWAMAACEAVDADVHRDHLPTSELERVVADLTEVAPQLREATFSLIESGRDIYGERFAKALGDVASSFLTSHEDLAMGRDFEAFRRSRVAARDPTRLAALQDYYWHAFLPQPVEREWLRRHDPELVILTHARNERMADYVVHEADSPTVHVLVGAAHQPGVIYYLRQYRDGEKTPGDFEYVE